MALFADDMILYVENCKDATRKLLELINESGKVAGYKVNSILTTKDQKEKLRNPIYYCIKKNKIPSNKLT